MSAASVAAYPLHQEGRKYWEELACECKRWAEAINTVLDQHGLRDEERVECHPGAQIRIIRSQIPSTTIEVNLDFYSWGPVISGTITGEQETNLKFALQEFELLIATDLDGSTIAIADEGRSLSPEALATYLTQNFRRCFPGISLCETAA